MAISVSPISNFSVTVLGSGTCTPSLSRQPAGYLVRYEGFQMLVDSGSGTIGRLMLQGVAIHDLDAVLYTHLHLDHTGDLFPMLFALRNSYGFVRSRDFRLFGPTGFAQFYDQLLVIFGRWIVSPQYQIDVQEIEDNPLEPATIGPFQVFSFAMRHTPHSLGYRLQAPCGRVVAFTGDADEGPNLIPLFHDATLAVVDCSMPDPLKLPGHLSPTGIGNAVAMARPKAVLLSHFYPPSDEADLETPILVNYRGKVQRAEDGGSYAIE